MRDRRTVRCSVDSDMLVDRLVKSLFFKFLNRAMSSARLLPGLPVEHEETQEPETRTVQELLQVGAVQEPRRDAAGTCCPSAGVIPSRHAVIAKS